MSEAVGGATGSKDLPPQPSISEPGASTMLESIGQFSTLFDKYVCTFSEQDKLREFRRYMAEKKVTNFIVKLYQFCNDARRKDQYMEHVVQDFLCSYPGESDADIEGLLEQRIDVRNSNVRLTKDIPRYELVVTIARELPANGCATWGEAANALGIVIERHPKVDPEGDFPWKTRRAFIEELEKMHRDKLTSATATFEELMARAIPPPHEEAATHEGGE
ncbi:unnamed protein product [Amoebophrya sp. A25]|nr:unnamed protein product [Amoebophrya sp. A25]|eukprot:GSA25T00006027001.1